MDIELYYINLAHRKDRAELMEENWSELGISANRVAAISFPEEKFGTKGCYQSHKKVLELISMFFDPFDGTIVISEDDVIPSKSFNDRLEVIMNEIPSDWNILMLGHSTTERSKFHHVTNNICKAVQNVLSGTCYVVNPKFYKTLLSEYNNNKGESDLDSLLMYLQKKYNVYMALPSLCYQYKSYSDNSKMILDNTELTKTYFKD